jgi:hypothetical protein
MKRLWLESRHSVIHAQDKSKEKNIMWLAVPDRCIRVVRLPD